MEPFWEKMGLSTEPQMWRASELLDCLRQHRQDGISIKMQPMKWVSGKKTEKPSFS